MDISLSGAEVALVGALLTAVTTPLLVLFKMLIADKDRQIERLEQQNEELLHGLLSSSKAVENTTQVLRQREKR